jgi:hypothetical protein
MVLMIAGDWWEENLAEMAWNMTKGIFLSYASASTVNGLVGDLFNCSGNQWKVSIINLYFIAILSLNRNFSKKVSEIK